MSNYCLFQNDTPYYQPIQSVAPVTPTPPSSAPTIPVVVGTPTTNSITVSFDISGITGTEPFQFSVVYGTTTSPTTPATAFQYSGNIYRAVVNGLSASTTYYFKSKVLNVSGTLSSAVSAGIATAGPAPPLQTYAVTTFLINGPLFATPYSTALNYYINCDAVGGTLNNNGSVTGTQLFGSFYCKTTGTIPPAFSPAGPWDGKCLSDINASDNSTQSGNYLTPLADPSLKILTCIGGYYADVRGLFSTSSFSVPNYPGTQPTADQVAKSICNVVLGESGSANPLSWSNSNWGSFDTFDGLVVDFENIGFGGIPGSNTYPPLPNPEPSFPAESGNPAYASYVPAMALFMQTLHQNAPNKLIIQAPLSLSINADALNFQGGKNVAVNNALNTWFPFPTSSVAPTVANYNSSPSQALMHPAQLQYCDDIFVQFYNAGPDYYVGGQYFANILAQWGFLALKTQALGTRKPKINIGLAKGVIIGSTSNPSVPNSQGVTAPLSTGPPPHTYWYPQWETASPPNPNAVQPTNSPFPNIGPTLDAPNLISAINTANSLLISSGLPNASSIVPSMWLSGGGFWAGGPATLACAGLFDKVPNLPEGITYAWSDAMYPAPDPLWTGNVPIIPI